MGKDNSGSVISGFAGFYENSQGGITPEYFEYAGQTFKIRGVFNGVSLTEETKGEPESSIQFAGKIQGVVLYLGRQDLRRSFVFDFSTFNSNTNTSAFNFIGHLFDESEDIGKPIPVWISTEPPPY